VTAYRVVILHCDGHSRVGPCEHDYAGQSGLTFAEVRTFAELQGWTHYGPAAGGVDYCPEHRPRPVTA
jgi:hypothetical protein